MTTTNEATMEPLFVRRPEAAKLLSMPLNTLEKLRDIPRIKIGTAVYYDVADLRAWMGKRKISASAC